MNRSRAQTTIDFAIGTSVFLITVAFVVAFIPGIFQPFANGPQEELAGIDRVADTLVYDLLDDGDGGATLDRRCTVAFFNGTTTDTGCRFDDSESFAAQVGLSASQHANVTVVVGDRNGGDPHPVCSDGTRVWGSATNSCSSGFAFDAGESIPSDGASVIGRRVVYVDGTTATVIVRMW